MFHIQRSYDRIASKIIMQIWPEYIPFNFHLVEQFFHFLGKPNILGKPWLWPTASYQSCNVVVCRWPQVLIRENINHRFNKFLYTLHYGGFSNPHIFIHKITRYFKCKHLKCSDNLLKGRQTKSFNIISYLDKYDSWAFHTYLDKYGKLLWNLLEDMLIIQQNSQEKAFCGPANDYV